MASLLPLHPSKPISPVRATAVSTQSLPAQALDEKFGRKGIRFTQDEGDVPSVELSVRNGSSLRLRIPDGLVTSYRPKVYWKDDGFEEVLHTLPDAAGTGPARGGLGLVLNDESKPSPWAAAEWVVKDADSDSIDAVQVELSCTNGDGSLDITYVVTLYPLSMATAVVVKNKGKKPAKLRSAILSHLKFKSRKGSAVQGLRGCSYCAHPPPASSFGILSPSDAMRPEPSAGWFSFSSEEEDAKGGLWTVEDDMYTILRGKLSRVYAAPPEERTKRIYRTPPSKFQTIDQGSKLGFRIIRMGFEDIYLSSPGSLSQKYGDQYFICTGPASILVPVDLKPGEDWRGAQVIEHDNL
ncbi:photosynthetic NDH subunit of subcomplex B 2, chloroplastic [Iris pallida]|uniref:Photosynthetic NDH subunit of subcomplex B 2, chloroplastic n=1 Tax=Iris pallida TaxID=29817 RepID=A0AAX6I4K4_IRIPA|nr:photosynthetic NDH subunit of subcomplex B 2, chloroplastic [Iris pallida]